MDIDIELREIQSPTELSSVTLHDRAAISTKAAITKHYAAIYRSINVAFVALDLPEDKSYLCVYELLVEPKLRGYGYGTAIINKCRSFAINGGYKTICLIPRPIEADGSEQKLRVWYSRLGFSQSPNQYDLLEIVF